MPEQVTSPEVKRRVVQDVMQSGNDICSTGYIEVFT